MASRWAENYVVEHGSMWNDDGSDGDHYVVGAVSLDNALESIVKETRHVMMKILNSGHTVSGTSSDELIRRVKTVLGERYQTKKI